MDLRHNGWKGRGKSGLREKKSIIWEAGMITLDAGPFSLLLALRQPLRHKSKRTRQRFEEDRADGAIK